MKFYIAGKITGDPDYKRKFNTAEKQLAERGHSVMNPAWIFAYPDFDYNDYIAVSTEMQRHCDAVLFLKDWKDSAGARNEYYQAVNQNCFFDIEDVPNEKDLKK